MIGEADSISVIADSSLISSPCFQKYSAANNVAQLSATNITLQAEQVKSVQVQFGTNPYDTSATTDSNNTVSTAQTYEPDVLGVSRPFFFFFKDENKIF
jgi:Tfp pilus assembly major pilin PilA